MELTSTTRSKWSAAPKRQDKAGRLSHRPLRLRYALAAIVLSMMGAHISADFEEQPSPEKPPSYV